MNEKDFILNINNVNIKKICELHEIPLKNIYTGTAKREYYNIIAYEYIDFLFALLKQVDPNTRFFEYIKRNVEKSGLK